MDCIEAKALLGAYVDNELMMTENAQVNRHVESCPGCRERLQTLLRLQDKMKSEDLYFKAPPGLEIKLFPKKMEWPKKLFGPFPLAWASAVVLVVFLLGHWGDLSNSGGLPGEVVSEHIRSLKSGHLVEVVSTDQHTVKPWFNGKVDFSPNVKDLAGDGYPLVGGRVDYLGGKAVAALVFKRRQHVINLFVWPEEHSKSQSPESFSKNGFNVLSGFKEGFVYWAVSDLNPGELKEFMQLYNK